MLHHPRRRRNLDAGSQWQHQQRRAALQADLERLPVHEALVARLSATLASLLQLLRSESGVHPPCSSIAATHNAASNGMWAVRDWPADAACPSNVVAAPALPTDAAHRPASPAAATAAPAPAPEPAAEGGHTATAQGASIELRAWCRAPQEPHAQWLAVATRRLTRLLHQAGSWQPLAEQLLHSFMFQSWDRARAVAPSACPEWPWAPTSLLLDTAAYSHLVLHLGLGPHLLDSLLLLSTAPEAAQSPSAPHTIPSAPFHLLASGLAACPALAAPLLVALYPLTPATPPGVASAMPSSGPLVALLISTLHSAPPNHALPAAKLATLLSLTTALTALLHTAPAILPQPLVYAPPWPPRPLPPTRLALAHQAMALLNDLLTLWAPSLALPPPSSMPPLRAPADLRFQLSTALASLQPILKSKMESSLPTPTSACSLSAASTHPAIAPPTAAAPPNPTWDFQTLCHLNMRILCLSMSPPAIASPEPILLPAMSPHLFQTLASAPNASPPLDPFATVPHHDGLPCWLAVLGDPWPGPCPRHSPLTPPSTPFRTPTSFNSDPAPLNGHAVPHSHPPSECQVASAPSVGNPTPQPPSGPPSPSTQHLVGMVAAWQAPSAPFTWSEVRTHALKPALGLDPMGPAAMSVTMLQVAACLLLGTCPTTADIIGDPGSYPTTEDGCCTASGPGSATYSTRADEKTAAGLAAADGPLVAAATATHGVEPEPSPARSGSTGTGSTASSSASDSDSDGISRGGWREDCWNGWELRPRSGLGLQLLALAAEALPHVLDTRQQAALACWPPASATANHLQALAGHSGPLRRGAEAAAVAVLNCLVATDDGGGGEVVLGRAQREQQAAAAARRLLPLAVLAPNVLAARLLAAAVRHRRQQPHLLQLAGTLLPSVTTVSALAPALSPWAGPPAVVAGQAAVLSPPHPLLVAAAAAIAADGFVAAQPPLLLSLGDADSLRNFLAAAMAVDLYTAEELLVAAVLPPLRPLLHPSAASLTSLPPIIAPPDQFQLRAILELAAAVAPLLHFSPPSSQALLTAGATAEAPTPLTPAFTLLRCIAAVAAHLHPSVFPHPPSVATGWANPLASPPDFVSWDLSCSTLQTLVAHFPPLPSTTPRPPLHSALPWPIAAILLPLHAHTPLSPRSAFSPPSSRTPATHHSHNPMPPLFPALHTRREATRRTCDALLDLLQLAASGQQQASAVALACLPPNPPPPPHPSPHLAPSHVGLPRGAGVADQWGRDWGCLTNQMLEGAAAEHPAAWRLAMLHALAQVLPATTPAAGERLLTVPLPWLVARTRRPAGIPTPPLPPPPATSHLTLQLVCQATYLLLVPPGHASSNSPSTGPYSQLLADRCFRHISNTLLRHCAHAASATTALCASLAAVPASASQLPAAGGPPAAGASTELMEACPRVPPAARHVRCGGANGLEGPADARAQATAALEARGQLLLGFREVAILHRKLQSSCDCGILLNALLASVKPLLQAALWELAGRPRAAPEALLLAAVAADLGLGPQPHPVEGLHAGAAGSHAPGGVAPGDGWGVAIGRVVGAVREWCEGLDAGAGALLLLAVDEAAGGAGGSDDEDKQ